MTTQPSPTLDGVDLTTRADLGAELATYVEPLRVAAEQVERLAGLLETTGPSTAMHSIESAREFLAQLRARLSWWRDPWADVAQLKQMHRSLRDLAGEALTQHRRYQVLRVLMDSSQLEYHPCEHMDQLRIFLDALAGDVFPDPEDDDALSALESMARNLRPLLGRMAKDRPRTTPLDSARAVAGQRAAGVRPDPSPEEVRTIEALQEGGAP